MAGNDIAVRQNQPEMIRCLAAQRQLYSEEKRLKMYWYAGVIAIALVGTFFLLATDSQITALALIVAVLEIGTLPFIKRKHVEAANIQELFDCEVLQLDRNKVLLVDRPDLYQIDGAVDRFNRQPKCEEAYAKLKDWYNGFTTDTPLTQARLICQKMNLGWDEEVRHEWQMWLYAGLVVVVILSFLLVVFRQLSVTDYFTGPFILLIPLAISAFKTTRDQGSVRRHIDQLKWQCDHLLQEATHIDADETAIIKQSRQIQDEIYRHRCAETTVPDFIYERVRKRREQHLPDHAAKK